MSNTGINILVLGKTGVGKSSFCNYIFDQELFRTGTGKPVTEWREHFQHETIRHDGFDLNLFDSVGIEADNLTLWKSHLKKLLNKHNHDEADPNQWIHGAFYLINAASARVEPTEIEIIKQLADEGIAISVILTNSDAANEEIKFNLKETIKQQVAIKSINIHEVCSVTIRKRSGSVIQKGKEDILKDFLRNLDSALCKKSLLYMINIISNACDDAKNQMRKKIKDLDLGVIKLVKGALNDNLDEIFNLEDDLFDDLTEKYENYTDGFDDFLEKLGYSGDSITSTSIENLTEKLDYVMNEISETLEKRLDSMTDGLESDSTWEQVKSVFKIGGVLLTLESTILQIFDELFDQIQRYLRIARIEVNETGCYLQNIN